MEKRQGDTMNPLKLISKQAGADLGVVLNRVLENLEVQTELLNTISENQTLQTELMSKAWKQLKQ